MNKYIKIIVSMLILSFVGIVACENAVSVTEETKTFTTEEKSKAFITDLSEGASSEFTSDKIALVDTEINGKALQYLLTIGFTKLEINQILFDKDNNRSLTDVDVALTWLAITVAISEIPELRNGNIVEKGKIKNDATTLDWSVYNCLFQAVGTRVGFDIIERANLSSNGGKQLLVESFSRRISESLGPLGFFTAMQFSACVATTIQDYIY